VTCNSIYVVYNALGKVSSHQFKDDAVLSANQLSEKYRMSHWVEEENLEVYKI